MLSFDVDDTIAAIASPHGPALRGIIRVCGPHCLDCLNRVFRVTQAEGPSIAPLDIVTGSNRPYRVKGCIELSIDSVDAEGARGLIEMPGELLVWPSKQSYTRQAAAEFHTIGSQPLLGKVLKQICEAGARVAQPGEFTLRAFLSGRLDLTQAEAVLSIIDAKAETQLSLALRQLAGGLSGPLMEVRKQLTWMLAEIEAGLDFVEEDIEFLSRDEIVRRLTDIEKKMSEVVSQIKSRDFGSQVLRVALVGLPNAGKSSIFNELLGSDRAIVSHVSGTTTDFLVGQLELDGVVVQLTDTAGIETVQDAGATPTRAMLAQQQRETIEMNSQIKLICVDATVPPNEHTRQQLASLELDLEPDSATLLVLTKSDLAQSGIGTTCVRPHLYERLQREHRFVTTQIPSADRLNGLRNAIRYHALNLIETQSEMVASTLIRTANSLRAANDAVRRALQCANSRAGEELIAAEIRLALDDIGLVVGTVYTDDILDVVFSRFCIGK